jgi:hypothetical protein
MIEEDLAYGAEGRFQGHEDDREAQHEGDGVEEHSTAGSQAELAGQIGYRYPGNERQVRGKER